MKNQFKWAILFSSLLVSDGPLQAQTVTDVLENGQKVDEGDDLFFTFGTETAKSDNSNIQFAFATGVKVPRTSLQVPTHDSFLLLPKSNNNLNVFVRPVNPLRYAYSDTSYDFEDAIDKAASEAIAALATQISTWTGSSGKRSQFVIATVAIDTCNLSKVQSAYDAVIDELKKEDVFAYSKIFQRLYDIAFYSAKNTEVGLINAGADTGDIKDHFTRLTGKVDLLAKEIDNMKCTSDKAFLYKHAVAAMLKEVKEQQQLQMKRYVLLQNVFAIVSKAYNEAAATTTDPNSSEWYVKRTMIPFPQGRITYYELSLYETGYHLNNGEIVPTNKKLLSKKTIRFRHFRRFIPEVSAGIAYTGLHFPKYGTTTDESGNHYVASAGEDVMKRVNFSAMLNFNYFIPDAGLHPFFQLGAGTNLDNPVLFSGIGARIPVKGNQRFAFSIGAAFGFIKQLDTLKIGDKVAGEADVQKDLKLELDPDPKLYIGLQIQL